MNSNIVYINVPKTGCSSIKQAMLRGVLLESNIKDDLSVHNITDQFGVCDNSIIDNTKFVFAFVRNPFERIVSLYLNKFLDIEKITKDGFLFRYYLGGIIGINSSFEDFVNVIVRIPDRLAEIHFKSQYSIIYEKKDVRIDFIGRFENFIDDFDHIRRLNSQLGELRHLNKTMKIYDYKAFYNKSLVQLVATRYRKDINVFGYEQVELELMNLYSVE